MSEDDADKSHEPTQKRLDDARKRGEIAKSADLTTAAGYGGLLIVALLTGASALQMAGQAGAQLLGQADRLAPILLAGGRAGSGGMISGFGVALAPLFLVPMMAALLVVAAQGALVFAPEKLAMKWSRLSPLANAQQKFGLDGLVSFAQSAAKLLVTGGLLAIFLPARGDEILASLQMSPAQGAAVMLDILLDFLFLALLATLVFGAADYFWQKLQHQRRNRMSRQELVEENKDSDGDPHAKSQRRQRGQDIALNQMLLGVGKADVIIVNPTHFAVALKWQRGDRSAPICVAKGVDEIAARIREAAAVAGVPLHSDPPTARALHASVEVGHPIRPEHYSAVAAAIRFAEAMRKRARKRRP